MKAGQVPIQTANKGLPHISGNISVLDAVKVMTSKRTSVVPVESTREPVSGGVGQGPKFAYALSGYTIISRLVQIDPRQYGRFLSEPCRNNALSIGSVSTEDDIVSLLQTFENTTFGYAIVKGNEGASRKLLMLKDMLPLYQKNIFSSDLKIREVASSPVFSASANSGIKDTLTEMLRRKFRRVLISNTSTLVSDKEIMEHVFQSERLETTVREEPQKLLEGNLTDLHAQEAVRLDTDSSLKDAAGIFVSRNLDCALTEGGIVTAWDMIMKPWRWGRLQISK